MVGRHKTWFVPMLMASLAFGLQACCLTGRANGKEKVEAAMQEYARLLRSTDAKALAEFYTPDGELLEPGMEALKGPSAIQKFLESFGDVKIESASMSSERIDIWGGDAMQWGSYAQSVALPGKPVAEFKGRFVAHWSRQPGGRWLIRRLLTQPG